MPLPDASNNDLVPIIPSTLLGIKFGIGIGIGIAIIWLPTLLIIYALIDSFPSTESEINSQANSSTYPISAVPPDDSSKLTSPILAKPSTNTMPTFRLGYRHSSKANKLSIPTDFLIYKISTADTLLDSLNKLSKTQQKIAFILTKGVYRFSKSIKITHNHIWLLSETDNPNDVIFIGKGMHSSSKVNNLIYVSGEHFKLSGITLKQASNHLIQIAGEKNADFPIIKNCILQDSYEQMIKVSYDKRNKPNIASDNGLIENCLFEYTQGIGPNYYIGGIDIHAGHDWQVLNNTFKNIASPAKHIAEHAIHFWNNTKNPMIVGNYIENCDRGIGLGMLKHSVEKNRSQNIQYSNFGGLIKQNYIYHADNGHPFADTGIILEDSANTIIEQNYVYLAHTYPRAIEYRYPSTQGVKITNNVTNKKISSRNGGQAILQHNTIEPNLLAYPQTD